ncbi:hypothetical protein WME94_33665 [Sorangium sp. So ce429]
MTMNVGVNVIEVDGRASPAIQPAQTSVAAFLGLTTRGVPDRPVRVSSPDQARERFGPPRGDAHLSFAVDGFFLNGGREAYINRIVGRGSRAASATLSNRATPAAPALRVSAGYRGSEDPGEWGNALRVDVRDDPKGRAGVPGGAGANAVQAVLDTVSGFQVGSVVVFQDGGTSVVRRLNGVDPGTRTVQWTTPIASALSSTTTATTVEFRLIVSHRPSPDGDFEVVEDWRNLSMEPDVADHGVTRINHAFTGSRYIVVTDVSGAALTEEEAPAVTSATALTQGGEVAPGTAELIGAASTRTGLYAFDGVQAQLLAVPDAHLLGAAGRTALVQSALDYCAARGDCMFVGSSPNRGAQPGVVPRSPRDFTQMESAYLSAILADSAQFQARKVYGALYAPWIQVADPTSSGPTPTRYVPPDGHVMGVYARTDLERGIFKAPAGNAATVRGALDAAATFTDVQHTSMVKSGLVNGIRREPGLGVIIAASRSLSTDTRWWFVNVRLLFNFVKSSLRDGLRFVRQEPHSEELRRTVRLNVVTPFLLGLWRRGAFGSDPPDKVFTVKCDAENNPPSEVDLGNFNIEVYFYPVKPVETIVIVVGQQPSGAAAGEQ